MNDTLGRGRRSFINDLGDKSNELCCLSVSLSLLHHLLGLGQITISLLIAIKPFFLSMNILFDKALIKNYCENALLRL